MLDRSDRAFGTHSFWRQRRRSAAGPEDVTAIDSRRPSLEEDVDVRYHLPVSWGETMTPRPLFDHGRMLDQLGVEGRLLVAATRDAPPEARAAGASGCTLAETVRHAGDSCENALSWMGTSESVPSRRECRTETGQRERFTARLVDLLAEFSTRPAQERCATWWPDDPSIGFWLRRVLHATTVHRVDVQLAAGVEMTPVGTEPACDGIDEALRLWFGHRLRTLGVTASRAWSVEIVTDDHRWVASADSEHTTAASGGSEHGGPPDGVITGDASAIYLWLWGRLPDRAVNSTGDPDAIAQLWSLLRLATQ